MSNILITSNLFVAMKNIYMEWSTGLKPRTRLNQFFLLLLILCCLLPLSLQGASHKPARLAIEKITIGEDTIHTGRKQLIEVKVKNYESKNRAVVVKLTITMPNQLIITYGAKRIVAKAKTETRALLVYPVEIKKAGGYVVSARVFSTKGKLIASSSKKQNMHFYAADKKHRRPKNKNGKAKSAVKKVVGAETEAIRKNPKRVEFDLPDLFIEELSVSNNNSILRGETAHINLVVSNDGGDVAQDIGFSASWYYQHRPKRRFRFYQDTIKIIAPGERKVMHLPLTIPEKEQKGKYLVRVVLDKPNYVKESNENNNEVIGKDAIIFSDIALEFPGDSHSFAEDGRFIFQWRSKQYNQFKVQISADEEFLDLENTFELPKGSKWASAKMIKPLVGEMPALAISLMEQNELNYLFWRVKAKNSQGESTVSSGRKFYINLLAQTN